MRFVDNCVDFTIAVLSTAICFVYTGRVCFYAKPLMAESRTRFRSVESSGCNSSSLQTTTTRRAFHDSSFGMADGNGSGCVSQGESSDAVALGPAGQSERLCTVRDKASRLALSAAGLGCGPSGTYRATIPIAIRAPGRKSGSMKSQHDNKPQA